MRRFHCQLNSALRQPSPAPPANRLVYTSNNAGDWPTKAVSNNNYSPDCMDKRNRYMVDHADFIIAVWDGRPSGTGKTVTYARGRNGKSIIVIDPVTLAIERL